MNSQSLMPAASGGLVIRAGLADSPFGTCLIAVAPQGICHVSFPEPSCDPFDELRAAWPSATLQSDTEFAADCAERMFSTPPAGEFPLPLMLRGSRFQEHVWRCLLEVPAGTCVSYSQLAAAAGCPGAARAVGSAVARNAIAWLVPCHRVIRTDGSSGGYRWGIARKQSMIAWEKRHATRS